MPVFQLWVLQTLLSLCAFPQLVFGATYDDTADATEGDDEAPGTCLLQKTFHKRQISATAALEKKQSPSVSFVWQRTLTLHSGKSEEQVAMDLPFSFLEMELETLADGIDVDKPIQPQVKHLFEKLSEMKHLKDRYTSEELHDFEEHLAEAVSEDVKLEEETEHRKPSKIELRKMLQQELFHQQPAVTQKMIDEINSQGLGWHASKDKFNRGMSLQQYDRSLGYISRIDIPINDMETIKNVTLLQSTIPEHFDGRTGFPKCSQLIGHVRDQGQCGSCWAQATVGAFQDRLCIASGGAFNEELSAADLTACDTDNAGCSGGSPVLAVRWLTKNGVVTGGDYNTRGDGGSCYPYPILDKNAKAHFQSQVRTPSCHRSCPESDYHTKYQNDKFYAGGDAYRIGRQYPAENSNHAELWAQVKLELSTKGSIMILYAATRSHMAYESGIWDCGAGAPNHGVKCIGYGVDPTHGNYITCVNSWNTDFGEKGLFRMQFPGNGCIAEIYGMPVEWDSKNKGAADFGSSTDRGDARQKTSGAGSRTVRPTTTTPPTEEEGLSSRAEEIFKRMRERAERSKRGRSETASENDKGQSEEEPAHFSNETDWTLPPSTDWLVADNKHLRVEGTKRCLDHDRNWGNADNVITYACGYTSNQMWTMNDGRLMCGNKCLDVDFGHSGTGVNVKMYKCHKGSNQKWIAASGGRLVTKFNGMCLDAAPSKENNVKVAKCDGSPNQKWTVHAMTKPNDSRRRSMIKKLTSWMPWR